MNETTELLRRGVGDFEPTPDAFERVLARRDRKRQNERVAAGVLGIAVFALAATGSVRLLGSGPAPAADPRTPFPGTWISTDGDGSTQTMTIRALGDGAVEITVQDDAASVCSGAPSTMTGTGRLEGSTELVVPSPVLTCDDGSEPEALSGPPLEEQLRDLTFVHDPQTDAFTDNFGSVWERVAGGDMSPEPATSRRMWPQSSLEEVREAQELADAGDPRYTWQVDPELAAGASAGDPEIIVRFLEEELGWEEFRWGVGGHGGESFEDSEGVFTSEGVFVRCAPGRTNPLYPNDPEGRGCAPTIDEFRYETVKIKVAQLGRRGPSGIWVVARWEMLPRSDEPMTYGEESFTQRQIEQVSPPADAEATALLRAFLQARIDGEGAQEFLRFPEDGEIPLLYATTTDAPYERSEIKLLKGPVWPLGQREFEVLLFAEGGKTVVEQFIEVDRDETGRLVLEYSSGPGPSQPATTENGQAVPVQYGFLDGEVTFHAAYPWDYSIAGWDHGPTMTTLVDGDRYEGRIVVVADPRPIGTRCQQGPAPANAEALARSIRSDRDFEATAPVAVSVGGTLALRMDVVTAAGASVCDVEGLPQVVTETGLDQGHRMRLYLLDLPGGSGRILAIAIVAPETRFERVVEATAPIVDSFEFHAR